MGNLQRINDERPDKPRDESGDRKFPLFKQVEFLSKNQ
jgi:hypothetical protein